mgnify:FL=1
MVSTFASQQEGSGFESRFNQGLSVWSLHVLPVYAWVLSGFSGFFPHTKDMQNGVRFIGDSKLTVGVNVRVNDCPCLYVALR